MDNIEHALLLIFLSFILGVLEQLKENRQNRQNRKLLRGIQVPKLVSTNNRRTWSSRTIHEIRDRPWPTKSGIE